MDFGFGSDMYYSDQRSCTMLELVTDNGSRCGRSHDGWPIYYQQKRSTLMLRKLLVENGGNESYKRAFINRFSLLLATYYAPTRVKTEVDALMNYLPYAERVLDRGKWGYLSMSENNTEIREFADARPGIMHNDIRNFFNLGSAYNDLTLSVSGGGRILVHDLPVLNGNATFRTYPSVPITIKAEGAGFKNWSDGYTNAERTVTITQATTLTANF